jgi:hypothetical protein
VNATKYIDVYIRNCGEIDVNIGEIYIDSDRQTAIDPVLPKKILIGTDQTEEVETFTVTFSWETDTAYKIKAITERGEIAITEVRSPSS